MFLKGNNKTFMLEFCTIHLSSLTIGYVQRTFTISFKNSELLIRRKNTGLSSLRFKEKESCRVIKMDNISHLHNCNFPVLY